MKAIPVGVATTESVGTAESNDFLVVKAAGIALVSQEFLSYKRRLTPYGRKSGMNISSYSITD
jgi:hypothetical protein